jgi:hypothetical protein
MTRTYSYEERYLRAEKRVKDMIGFYTHLFVTVIIVPFIIFLNLEMVPQFHWFWIFIGAWSLGVLIHGINVFGIAKMSAKKEWELKKIQEIAGEDFEAAAADRSQELSFINAKKRVQEIKGFYAHLIVTVCTIPLIIWVNLEFVPGFHFFWFAAGGMLLAVFFHWLGVYGISLLGFGKEWEQRKIQEIMQKDYN